VAPLGKDARKVSVRRRCLASSSDGSRDGRPTKLP
jgi:hypothetical protein